MEAVAVASTIGRRTESQAEEDSVAPSWLPQPQLKNSDVPPQDWALTLDQFLRFVDTCRETGCWRDAKDAKGHVNLYDIIEVLVKPWTRRTGAGIALRLNPEEPLRAQIMISHCWGEDMDECCEALRDYCKRTSLESSTGIWFCAFSQYQPGDEPGDPGPTVAQQLNLDPFGSVVKAAQRMVVVHTSVASVYDRLWCVYEISEALNSETPVHIAYSKVYLKLSDGSLTEMLHARTAEAHCACSDDEERIRESICSGCGFGILDHKIFQFRLEAVQEMSEELGSDWLQRMETELRSAEDALKREQRQLRLLPWRAMLLFGLLLAVGLAVALIVIFFEHTSGSAANLADPGGTSGVVIVNSSLGDGYDGNNTTTSTTTSVFPNDTTTTLWLMVPTMPGPPPAHQQAPELWVLLAIPALAGLAFLWCCWRYRVARRRQPAASEELNWRLEAVRAMAAQEGKGSSRRLVAQAAAARENGETNRRLVAPGTAQEEDETNRGLVAPRAAAAQEGEEANRPLDACVGIVAL